MRPITSGLKSNKHLKHTTALLNSNGVTKCFWLHHTQVLLTFRRLGDRSLSRSIFLQTEKPIARPTFDYTIIQFICITDPEGVLQR